MKIRYLYIDKHRIYIYIYMCVCVCWYVNDNKIRTQTEEYEKRNYSDLLRNIVWQKQYKTLQSVGMFYGKYLIHRCNIFFINTFRLMLTSRKLICSNCSTFNSRLTNNGSPGKVSGIQIRFIIKYFPKLWMCRQNPPTGSAFGERCFMKTMVNSNIYIILNVRISSANYTFCGPKQICNLGCCRMIHYVDLFKAMREL